MEGKLEKMKSSNHFLKSRSGSKRRNMKGESNRASRSKRHLNTCKAVASGVLRSIKYMINETHINIEKVIGIRPRMFL